MVIFIYICVRGGGKLSGEQKAPFVRLQAEVKNKISLRKPGETRVTMHGNVAQSFSSFAATGYLAIGSRGPALPQSST